MVHALRTTGTWVRAVIATASTAEPYQFGWDLTRYNQPRVSFQNTLTEGLRHGARLRTTRLNATNHWRIETPSAKPGIGLHYELFHFTTGRH